LPKRKAIVYSKPYPSDYDLIPLPPKYRLPEFTKFNGSEGASSYFALGGNNCHMQIGCHKAYAVGSCPKRPAWKMDVCIVRVRYPISAHESSQRIGTGESCCRQDQH